MAEVRAVCVFCGSSIPNVDAYAEATRDLGRLLAERGLDLVYGGGQVGLMGILADATLAAGGRVVGVIPVGLFTKEVGHTGLSELIEVHSMHERKQLMYDLAGGFIGLPGGLGTLEELAEIATWSQLGLHEKPIVLLNVEGFWDPLRTQLDRMVDSGLLNPTNRRLVRSAATPEEALTELVTAELGPTGEWITEVER